MDRSSSYRPGPDYDIRDSRRGYDRFDRDRPPPPRDDRPPPPPPDGGMFRFRGAANSQRDSNGGDIYRPDHHGGDNYRPGGYGGRRDNDRKFDFDFQSGNAPSFAPSTDYPSSRRGPRAQQQRDRQRDRPYNARGGRGGRGRGRGGYVPKRPGDRALLRTEREPTPEQLEGMAAGQSRFKALENLSESDSEEMDLGTSDDEDPHVTRPAVPLDDSDSEDEHPRAKRARIQSPVAVPQEESKPKWSNPDPYWALPPTEEGQRNKKDVVKLIRKAKVEAAKPQDASNAASDFISLNFDDDADDAKSASESGELSASENERNGGQRAAATDATPPKATDMTLPAGRLDVWPPPPPDADPTARGAFNAAAMKQDIADSTASARQKSAQKGKKRKRNFHDLGDIVEEWSAPEDVDPTPWLRLDGDGCPSLHQEIIDFYEYVRPRDFEEQVRLNLVRRIQQAIQPRFPQVQIKPFGSFASGLYLPTADMDLVAVSQEFLSRGLPRIATNNQMRKFADCLVTAKIVKPGSLTVITGARVPIIKLVDNETGLRVDVSFENNSGITAQRTFEEWKIKHPAMTIIVALIKQFLVMRGLSEVFSGGLGGYSVICLVVSSLRRLAQAQEPDWDPMQHLDHILMDFLIHYSEEFDRYSTGIQMEPWGYINKTLWTPRGAKKAQPERLLIIDPNKYDNDISGGSKNVDIIFDSFRRAYRQLNDSLDEAEEVYERDGERMSILERIWGGNYSLFEVQRARLRSLWDGQTRPAGFPRGSIRPLAPPSHPNRNEPNKKLKTPNGNMSTKESPIDLEGPRTLRSATKPGNHGVGKTSKSKGDKTRNNSSDHSTKSGAGDSEAPKAKAAKKEKKKKKKTDEGAKSKQEKLSESSRALAFKKAHPGIACPTRLSKAEFKTLTKKHGTGIAT
ncbi:hypothetical protein AAFC00_001486 [Neodothiora populina]|uniref:Poly(A) RNA polymerase mitochondrial-like central palm domain-containing protein n=1 Tax=Neodothiora populina TaxID=2781224 RepID=A0ABR3PPB9_9PEZI